MRINLRWVLTGLFVVLAVAPLSAAPDEIVLRVLQARATVEDTDTVFGNNQDFFVFARVNGVDGQSPVVEGKDHAIFNGFEVRAPVDSTEILHELEVTLLEDDNTSGTDTFDINSIVGLRTLTLTFDACRWELIDTPAGSLPAGQPVWFEGDGDGDSDFAASLSLEVDTGSGLPFNPDDVAVRSAVIVQSAFGPRQVVEGKPLAVKIDLASTFDHTVNGTLTVTVQDSVDGVTRVKTVTIPSGLSSVMMLDDLPFVPTKGTDPTLSLLVNLTVPEEPYNGEQCGSLNNELAPDPRPILATADPVTVYQGFDAPIDSSPANLDAPSVMQVQTTFTASESFRKAIFPLATTNSSFATTPIVDVNPTFPFNFFGPQLGRLSLGASSVGIERWILLIRPLSLLNLDLSSPGVSLGEFAPRAVFVDVGTTSTAAHEIGHTFTMSQRFCTNGGIAEDWFGLGCRDERDHPAPPRPFNASGFDVENAQPALQTGPGREVAGLNFMDGNSGSARWIDTPSLDFLTEKLRDVQDPELLHVWGRIRDPGALQQVPPPQPAFEAELFYSYRFDGLPDVPLPPIDTPMGDGHFELRLAGSNGDYRVRFDPGFPTDEPNLENEYGWFSFNLPWPGEDVYAIRIFGPDAIDDENLEPNVLLTEVLRTSGPPVVSELLVERDNSPVFGSPQTEPPTIIADSDAVVGWLAGDVDSPDLHAILQLRPPPGGTGYDGWYPIAIDLADSEFRVPHAWLAERPGLWDAKVLVTDGVNTTEHLATDAFNVCVVTNNGLEACDGVDNDCNGVVDDVVPPMGVMAGFTRSDVTWQSHPTAQRYDAIVGKLDLLREFGFSDAVQLCVADDTAALSAPFHFAVPPGEAAFALVRGLNCAGVGSWDSEGAGQVAPRDADVAASTQTCP